MNPESNLSEAKPLPMPEDFDPNINMLFVSLDGKTLHPSRTTAGFAEQLIANGTPPDLELAHKVLDAVLECQERHPGDFHFGNFRWMREDDCPRDVNGVEFVLKYLVSIMIRHPDRLLPEMRQRVVQSIRDGLGEICRLDVAPTYTNIAVLDATNSSLGGEFLENAELAQRGYRKLKAISDITAANGAIFEYNSPTYIEVTLDALRRLAEYTRDDEARIRARAMAARLALSVALHIHGTTGRWVGPHSRAYYPTVVCTVPPEIDRVREWCDKGMAPRWIEAALDSARVPSHVVETAHADWRIAATTYLAPNFAMGVATREISRQSNVVTVHYPLSGKAPTGVMYVRYLLDDHWFGDPQHTPMDPRPANLFDDGKFYGVQCGPRAIGVYAPRTVEHFATLAPCSRDIFGSAKAVIVWARKKSIEEVWVGGQRVTQFPTTVALGDVIVVGAGPVWMAVRPFTVSDMGHDAPMRLAEGKEELVLELYNYLGPKKAHNELERRSRFYRGQPQCAFYVEVADRAEYPDGKSFAEKIASGAFKDEVAPAKSAYMTHAERPWTLEYSRDGHTIGIEVDLMEWELKRRWTHEGELGWPMLESAVARQTNSGRVEVAGAVLECGKAPAWLFGNPEKRLWVAGYHGEPAPLTLTSPDGRVEIEAMATGTVIWDNGSVLCEAIALRGEPRLVAGTL